MLVTIGNIFESNAKTLVNTVNCVGVMGKGIARDFKERFPDMYRDYKKRCAEGSLHPGKPYLFTDLFDTSILNFHSKDHWRSSSRLSYVEEGLDWFRDHWKTLGITSIAFPPLGCGNGGLAWEDVGPLIFEKLHDLPIDITIYAPYGTPQHQLADEFLSSKQRSTGAECGTQGRRYDHKWDLILHVVRSLNTESLILPVGRTIFQKICYILTRSGAELGFRFTQGDYGPYSVEATNALAVIANNNLIHEKTFGKMIQIEVVPSFQFDAARFTAKELRAAEKTIDLFRRIRNTEQAELSTTLIYSYDQLCESRKQPKHHTDSPEIEADAVIDYTIDWKPRWATQKKREELNSELFYLTALEWIKVSSFSSLPVF